MNADQKFKVAEAVANQIWVEQQLTASRMTWNLTFQGFLLAGFVLSFSREGTSVYLIIAQVIIAMVGGVAAFVTLSAIEASQIQRDYQKNVWRSLYNDGGDFVYPRPFSENTVSAKGRHAPGRIIVAIIFMWIGLAATTVAANSISEPSGSASAHAATSVAKR